MAQVPSLVRERIAVVLWTSHTVGLEKFAPFCEHQTRAQVLKKARHADYELVKSGGLLGQKSTHKKPVMPAMTNVIQRKKSRTQPGAGVSVRDELQLGRYAPGGGCSGQGRYKRRYVEGVAAHKWAHPPAQPVSFGAT